jgi:hypothetical protein
MYFAKLYNESMYQFVLAKDTTVFRGYDVVTQGSNVTEHLSSVHNSISVSLISKNTLLTCCIIYSIFNGYVLSAY